MWNFILVLELNLGRYKAALRNMLVTFLIIDELSMVSSDLWILIQGLEKYL